MIYKIQWTKLNTLLYKNISLSFYSRKGHTVCCNFDRDAETYTQRGDFFLPHIFFLEPRGCQRLHPHPCKPYHQRQHKRLWSVAYSWLNSRFWLNWLSKSDGVVLISRGLLPDTHVLDRLTPTHLPSPCLLITTWQLVKAHGVIRNEPNIHVNSHYITFRSQ